MFSTNNILQNKEAIALRMFKNAAKNWGLTDANIDDFDPLVRLLIEACAVELYRVDQEMINLQRSMTEKLAGILIPEAYVAPRPAHGIIHATSSDASMYVTMETQFLFKKKIATVVNGPLDDNLDVFFSPAGRYKSINGDVKIIAFEDKIFKLENLERKSFLKTKHSKYFENQNVWVGIKIDAGCDVQDLSLFFDLQNTPDKNNILSSLKYTKCYLENNILELKKGLIYNQENNTKLDFENFIEELYINKATEKLVANIYSNHFLSFPSNHSTLESIPQTILTNYPKIWEEYIEQNDLQQLDEKLVWIQLQMPPAFNSQILEDLTIAINCFPIVNRHLNDLNYRLNSFFNIIPLLSNEQFFSVHAVEGTSKAINGRTDYVFYPFDKYLNDEKGIYSVRHSDLQRFDDRNAAEYLNYLVELLRDESRAFSAFGQDFLSATIKEINQNIELIAQKIKQNTNLLYSSPTYLLINPIEEKDTIYVKYWTCLGKEGNGIRSRSKLELYEGSNFLKNSLMLMTQTSGGSDKLKQTETLTAFKSVLLSRNRLVTSADIKNFCISYLQEKVNNVTIEKGVAISTLPTQGLIPVVNVILNTSKVVSENKEEWDGIKQELLTELVDKSAVEMNYQIILN